MSSSQELLGHPDLQKMDPMKKVDLLLFTELAVKAKNKLLDNVQVRILILILIMILKAYLIMSD